MTENVTALVTRDSGSGRERVGAPCAVKFATSVNSDLLRATARSYVDDRPAKIAAEAVKRLDELALLGYPILDPAIRSVYEVAIRHVAEGVLDR